MVNIYILKCQKNKFYIGKTNDAFWRLNDHFNRNGSAWTKKYKPIKVEKLIKHCDDYDEDKYTIKYMGKYGLNNVRGGSFCEMELSNENKNTIKRMINGSTDKCYMCGENGHFANDCENDENNIMEILIKENRCFRCMRIGHYENDCYAKTYINGEYIYDSDDSD